MQSPVHKRAHKGSAYQGKGRAQCSGGQGSQLLSKDTENNSHFSHGAETVYGCIEKLLRSKISEEKYWQILIPKARNETQRIVFFCEVERSGTQRKTIILIQEFRVSESAAAERVRRRRTAARMRTGLGPSFVIKYLFQIVTRVN